MKILFCNITYMNNYTGITDEDTTGKGGKWVEENKDAHEQWNFLNNNGYCYGFVMNKGDQFAIERIDESASKYAEAEDVTVVWCALKSNETVVVGWYEHAKVYRNYQESIFTPISGLDRIYFCKAKAEDCYLLPEVSRTFRIPRASQAGKGKGFGQQNYWYAESSFARNELIPSVIDFLDAHKHERINRTASDFEAPHNTLIPLSGEEKETADIFFDHGNYYEFLPYGYRNYYSTKTADAAYEIAVALSELHQYNGAIKWYNEVVEIEGHTWDTDSHFPYLYQQCERFEDSTESALALLKYKEADDAATKHEIYSVIADNHYNLGNIKEAISWLDKILAESNDSNMITLTTSVKEIWSKLI